MGGVEGEDTGIGMDPEIPQERFEAFTPASEGGGRKYEGGTKEVLGQMGGVIQSRPRGAGIIVRLPKTKGETGGGGS